MLTVLALERSTLVHISSVGKATGTMIFPTDMHRLLPLDAQICACTRLRRSANLYQSIMTAAVSFVMLELGLLHYYDEYRSGMFVHNSSRTQCLFTLPCGHGWLQAYHVRKVWSIAT
jgi:hypothetical protein